MGYFLGYKSTKVPQTDKALGRCPRRRSFFLRVLDRGAQVVAAAATHLQREKNNSTDVQRKRATFTHCSVELSGCAKPDARGAARCFFRKNLIVVPRSLPRRHDAVAARKEQTFCCAAETSKFYPCVALNYPGARHHGCCQL
jgi:hypothetical protein